MLKTKRPVSFGGDTGQMEKTGGEPDLIHKCLISGLKNQAVKFALPWIATVITALPYNQKRSLFLDRLTVFVEGE
ncbi:MAG: hypothetical protein WC836_11935 [Desulfobacula sp.]|jgi:hypothetical protein